MVGVLALHVILPLTYFNYILQPTDLPNLVFMLLGLELLADRQDGWLLGLLPIAMLNRETAIFLVLLYLLLRYDDVSRTRLALMTGSLSVLGLGTYIGLRWGLGACLRRDLARRA